VVTVVAGRGVRTVLLPDYIACANGSLGIEFSDDAPLPQVVFQVCLRSRSMKR
jgi:hypothetical protein